MYNKDLFSLTRFVLKDINAESISDDCRLPGVLYQGTKNVTETGRPCQRWDKQSPHEHGYDVFSLAKENYCRNFDREEPWCFTNNPDVRWELCGVEVCGILSPCRDPSVTGDSFVVIMINFAIPCFKEFFRNTTDGPTLCRYLFTVYLDMTQLKC
ncbi:hepatocyte growth factor-like protein [Saccostrea cucullata]|uniref:hepatocyte growth factor-like protein n=1 Tax=Saccostrea cuccullata TaxID=36930 RepID=UPI002ED3768B